MSKLYSRPRTPPSPPPFSQKSSNSRSSRHDSHKSFDEPSKSYSNRDYGKYSSYDKFEKSDKFDRYDKLEKSSYKSGSYLSNKEYSQDYSSSSVLKGTSTTTSSSHSDKYFGKSSSSRSYQDDSYRSKDSVYGDQSYSDRDSYLSKYPSRNNDKYSKYSSPEAKSSSDGKYSKHGVRISMRNSPESNKKYPTYPVSKSIPYSKYGSDSNSFYPKNDGSYDSFDSYDRGRGRGGRGKGGDREVRGYSENSSRRDNGKGYSNSDNADSYSGEYQRYVIGDSVVYGSPGHYPKDIYPSSPKSKRERSPHSPAPLLSSSSKNRNSSGKNFSRYSSSPKRYNSSTKSGSLRDDTYPRSSPTFRKPRSPPPHSYQGLTSHSKGDRSSSNYGAPPDRGKAYDNRYDLPKNDRLYDQRNSNARDSSLKSNSSRDFGTYRRKDGPYVKPYSAYDRPLNHPRDRYPKNRPPPLPLMSIEPQPLLSIPLSISNLPIESRAHVRETLGIPYNKPLNGMDKGGRGRRLEGRIGSRKRLPLSPKDRKRRRPDDLRLWIEYRKNEGGRANNGPVGGTGRGGQAKRRDGGANRSRLLDSRRRILNKGKKKGVVLRRDPRRLLPPKSKTKDDNAKPSDSSRKTDTGGINESRNRDDGSKRRKEKSKAGDSDHDRITDNNRGSGGVAKSPGKNLGAAGGTRRPVVRRPRVVSQANRLPLKSRPVKRTMYRSSPDKDKNSSKSEKSYHHSTKSKTRDRSRSRTRSRSRSKSRTRSPRSPKRSEKDDTASSSRH